MRIRSYCLAAFVISTSIFNLAFGQDAVKIMEGFAQEKLALNSFQEKWDVLEKAKYIYDKRVEVNLHGYENNEEFKSSFESFFSELTVKLLSDHQQEFVGLSRSYLNEAKDSLTENVEANSEIYARYIRSIEEAGWLRMEQVLKTQYLLTIIADQYGMYDTATEITGVYPFCLPRQ